MKLLAACIAVFFLAPAFAQTPKPDNPDAARERAMQRCKENRGTNCDTREGLAEWTREEQPISAAEQQAAAAARRHRETCAKNRKAPGC